MDSKDKNKHRITPEGSLGILAYGDITFRKWREIKNGKETNFTYEEEE